MKRRSCLRKEPSRSLRLSSWTCWKPLRRWSGAERISSTSSREPDFDTPECIKEGCIRALREGKTHYTHSLGLLELREAVCEHYQKRYGVAVLPDQVLITSGTSPAMMNLFATILEKVPR